MRVIMFGFPGAGKGTQGKLLADWLGTPHVSLGDYIRDLVAGGTSPLAQPILAHWQSSESWQPLPDELALSVAQSALDGRFAWVLDGFPRNLVQLQQASFLDPVDAIVFLHVSEEISIQRVLGRMRQDDSEQKTKQRLWVERQRFEPLLDYCRQNFCFVEVDGSLTVEKVAGLIRQDIRLGGW